MDTKDELLRVNIRRILIDYHRRNDYPLNKAEDDMIALIEEQESNPVYDEAYLNECIEKATPNLSKIKNVDNYLAEIRGEFESISRIDDPHEGKYYELKFNNPVKSLCLGRDDCLVRWLFWINKKVTPINIYFIGNEIKEINPFCHICEFENKMKE